MKTGYVRLALLVSSVVFLLACPMRTKHKPIEAAPLPPAAAAEAPQPEAAPPPVLPEADRAQPEPPAKQVDYRINVLAPPPWRRLPLPEEMQQPNSFLFLHDATGAQVMTSFFPTAEDGSPRELAGEILTRLAAIGAEIHDVIVAPESAGVAGFSWKLQHPEGGKQGRVVIRTIVGLPQFCVMVMGTWPVDKHDDQLLIDFQFFVDSAHMWIDDGE